MVVKNESGLSPTADKVLVKMLKIEEKTSGGIILPDQVQEKHQIAQQVGILLDWGSTAMAAEELEGIELGDPVLFTRYSGVRYVVEKEEFWIMRAREVLGKATKLPDFMLWGADSSREVFGVNDPMEQAIA
jgi:chaperonin GroES